jgi:hypothetical protein
VVEVWRSIPSSLRGWPDLVFLYNDAFISMIGDNAEVRLGHGCSIRGTLAPAADWLKTLVADSRRMLHVEMLPKIVTNVPLGI